MSQVFPMSLTDFRAMRDHNEVAMNRVQAHIRHLENLGYRYAVRMILEADDLYALLSAQRHVTNVLDSHISDLAELLG